MIPHGQYTHDKTGKLYEVVGVYINANNDAAFEDTYTVHYKNAALNQHYTRSLNEFKEKFTRVERTAKTYDGVEAKVGDRIFLADRDGIIELTVNEYMIENNSLQFYYYDYEKCYEDVKAVILNNLEALARERGIFLQKKENKNA